MKKKEVKTLEQRMKDVLKKASTEVRAQLQQDLLLFGCCIYEKKNGKIIYHKIRICDEN